MPSESDRWKHGPLRNTIGHTDGATGAVTGGTEGHVKADGREPRNEKRKPSPEAADTTDFDFGAGG